MLFLFSLALAENLQVTSDLEGVPIYINGADSGYLTPATIPNLAPGKVKISVSQGCRSGSVTVNLPAGKSTKASVLTMEEMGSILVIPKPVTAKLWLDGTAIQAGTATEVACGDHKVKATLDGYAPEEITVTIDSLDPVNLPIPMHKLGLSTIDLTVTPRSAVITLDGEQVGSDVVNLPSVTEGYHTIGAEMDGYKSAEQNLKIKGNNNYSFQIKLVSEGSRKDSQVLPYGDLSRSVMIDTEPPPEEAAAFQAAAEEPPKSRTKEKPEVPDEEALPEETPEEEAVPEEATAEEPPARPSKPAAEVPPEEALPEEDETLPEEADVPPEELDDGVPDDLDEPAPKKEEDRKGHLGVGLGLLGGSLLTGAGAFYSYELALSAFERYDAKASAAKKHPKLQADADKYEADYNSKRTLFYGATGLTVALLAGGVTAFFVDDSAEFVLVPGGGMMTWTGHF